MDDKILDKTAHFMQGPHMELGPQERDGFAPLKLMVHPGGVAVEIAQTSAILGRHSRADVRLAFSEVSRQHARVVFENGQWRIHDLDSLNGIWINGERMHEAILYDGDRVRIGSCVLSVERGTPAPVVKTPRRNDHEVLKSIADVLPRQAG